MPSNSRDSAWHLTLEELAKKASLMVLSSSERKSRRLANKIDSYLRDERGFPSRLRSIGNPLIEKIIFKNEPNALVLVVPSSQEARKFLIPLIPALGRPLAVVILAPDLDAEILCDYYAQVVWGNLSWPTGKGEEEFFVKTIHLVLRTAYILLETLPFNSAELLSSEPFDTPAP